jgi:hypothetical protein
LGELGSLLVGTTSDMASTRIMNSRRYSVHPVECAAAEPPHRSHQLAVEVHPEDATDAADENEKTRETARFSEKNR